jgi:hypothetical protein
MRRHATAVPLLLVLTLAACSDAPAPAAQEPLAAPSTDAPAAGSEPAEAPPAAAPIDAPSLEALPFAASLAAGTPYADARAALQAAGWRPIVTDACAENVGGEAAVCRELPELEACSGTGAGYCLMAFGSPDAAQALSLRTSGGHDGWAATGDAATVRLDRAELAAVSPPADRTCGSGDFMTFLETFAADPTVRAAWTAPLVRVALRYDLGEDSVDVAAFQRAAEFGGFPVTHQGEAFHHVDANGAVDMAPLALRVTEPDADTRDVAFDYGMSEGNRVRFIRSGECWQLAEDPDPPSS